MATQGWCVLPLDFDLTEYHNTEVNKTLCRFRTNGEISSSLEKKLITAEPKTPEIYFLPKIHKNIQPPPRRAIVSANRCPTEKISALVDIYLTPFLPKIRSYLKDTTHFLKKIGNLKNLPSDTLLCTLDVNSLYTNIQNIEGLQVTAHLLMRHRPTQGNSELSNSSIVNS